jgi:hypothetical protein
MARANRLVRTTETQLPRPRTVLPDPVTTPTLSVPEAGKILGGLCEASSYAAANRGDIPTIRIGRRRIVPTAALLRMLGFEQPLAR